MISDYDVEYKKSVDSVWIDWPHTGTGRTTTVTGLDGGNVRYDVQVRAENAQGEGPWGTDGYPIATPPVFPPDVNITLR